MAGIFAKEKDSISFSESETERCLKSRKEELDTQEYDFDEEFRYVFSYEPVEVK